MKRPRFISVPDPDAETLFGVEMPGCRARRRHDRRAKVARPDKPLVMYFTRAQLTTLRANVAKAILRGHDERHQRPGSGNERARFPLGEATANLYQLLAEREGRAA